MDPQIIFTSSMEAKSTIVDTNIKSRHAVRAFLPKEVPHQLIREILDVAKHTPSGINTQPWHVYVLTGPAKEALSEELLRTFTDPEAAALHEEEYSYYPQTWETPYRERRDKVAANLYGLLNVAREDKEGRLAQHARNFQFFGAPVGLFFTIDRVMEQGSLLDYGMFLQNVMLAAKARELDTCCQVAFNKFHKTISKHLKLSEREQLVCGMSLGYADNSKIVNTLVTDREPVENFTRFIE